jgi:hypothetical protein
MIPQLPRARPHSADRSDGPLYELGAEVAELLAARAVEALAAPPAEVEAYGKGAIVGVAPVGFGVQATNSIRRLPSEMKKSVDTFQPGGLDGEERASSPCVGGSFAMRAGRAVATGGSRRPARIARTDVAET